MKYSNVIQLKDGRACLLTSGKAEYAADGLRNGFVTHEETDFLLSYPGESGKTEEDIAAYYREMEESDREVEILALVDDHVVGSAGVFSVGKREKVRHRSEFGISVEKAYWGLGIGRALLEASLECAGRMGYSQMELQVVKDNTSARRLYESEGFLEYGRLEKGFFSKYSGWQELILMVKELENEG